MMLHLLALRFAIALSRSLYALMKRLPLRFKVTLISRQSSVPSRDFVMLAEEIRRRDPVIEVVTLCHVLREGLSGRVGYLGTVLSQMYHLATSRACVVDGYVIPVSVLTHRPELTVVQMWHALGAMKKFGHQCLDTPEGRESELAQTMRMHEGYDVVICGGPGAVPVFAEAFGVECARVVPLGLPRIDYLLERAEQTRVGIHPPALSELLARHPEVLDDSKKRILYAPTFRRGHATALDALAGHFDPDRHVLLVKPHTLEKACVGCAPHLVDATGIAVLDLLPLCDVVITDYSAVAFESYALDKPVYYYVYDIEIYRPGCGLNIDPLVALPHNSSTELEDIACLIDSGEYDAEAARDIAARHLPSPLKGSTARIADLIIDGMRGARSA